MDKLSKEEVLHVAKLARLELSDEEIEKYRKDLKDLFDDNKGKGIFYDLLISILKAMLLVEGIGEMEV